MSSGLSSARVLTLCSALVLLTVAIGCAPLPYLLAQNRENIVAVEIALQPEGAFAAPANPGAHVALVKGFIRSSDIDELQAVVARVVETTKLDTLAPAADASPALQRFEERIVEGFRPFAVYPKHAKAIEFIQTPNDAPMSDATIVTLERYLPDATGVRFRPQASAFRPAGVAAYQIGATGKAERLLWTSAAR